MLNLFHLGQEKDETETTGKTVSRDTIVGNILDMDASTAPIFLAIGMHCLGCPASRGETLEQACAVHGVDCDELIAKINTHIAQNA